MKSMHFEHSYCWKALCITTLLSFGCGCLTGSGEVSFLTYNVAGLPDSLSGSSPANNIPQISPLLNTYDIVLVQEDFAYHDDVIDAVTHPYLSEEKVPQEKVVNDGLNRMSNYAFDGLDRQEWETCSGGINDCSSDCLAEKGFSFARTELASGLSVDIYNHHADAGGCEADVAARRVQFTQLANYIEVNSLGRAVIVAGDTNLKGFTEDDEPILQEFLTSTAMQDACRFLVCGQEEIDRFLFRSGEGVEVLPIGWEVAGEFVGSDNEDLSDHPAVHVDFSWIRR
jgi:hypothetical protein